MTLSQKDVTDLPNHAKNQMGNTPKGSGIQNLKVATASLLALSAMGLTMGGINASRNASSSDAYMPTYEMVVAEVEAADGVALAASTQAGTKKGPNQWLIGGAMALILGALYKVVGANRMMNIVANAGPAVRRTMTATKDAIANAPKMAAKAAASAVASPMKMLLLIGGLAMIGFTGVSVFDLHWGAGIVTGIGMTALTWAGTSKFMKKLRPQPIRVKRSDREQADYNRAAYNRAHQNPYDRSSHYNDR